MRIGEYFMRFGANVYQYSPIFPRGAEAAVFAVEVYALTPLTALNVEVQYKNLDETSWTTHASAISANAAGVYTLEVRDIREEVRLRYSVSGSNPTDTVYADILAPQWRA
jgi:hypothetical protein